MVAYSCANMKKEMYVAQQYTQQYTLPHKATQICVYGDRFVTAYTKTRRVGNFLEIIYLLSNHHEIPQIKDTHALLFFLLKVRNRHQNLIIATHKSQLN